MVFHHRGVPAAGLVARRSTLTMVAHEVPFMSQQSLREVEWRRYGCGIAALGMVFDYWHRRHADNHTEGVDDLYARGLAAGAFDPEIGWWHAGLVGLATSRGYESFNRDFGPRSRDPRRAEDALADLGRELRVGPVIASVYHDFDPARGGGHLVVVTGVAGDAVRLNDPLPARESDGRRTVPVPEFLRAFKHRFIVVRPQNPDAAGA
jgi:hypothetical protein